MPFSSGTLSRVLRRHPQKLRVRRQLLACQRRGDPSRFPEARCKELLELCLEIEALEPGLSDYLEQRVPSRAARQRLQARWRRVREANRVQQTFAEDWTRGGVVDAGRIPQVVAAIASERRDLDLFVRDLAPRLRPRLAVVRLGGDLWAPRALAGAAIAPRIDPIRRVPLELAYHHVACFDSWPRALAYRGLYRSYCRALLEDCALRLPWGAERIVARPGRRFEVYVATERHCESRTAAELLADLPETGALTLGRLLFGEFARVWRRRGSPGDGGLHVAVAGRLEHWAVEGAGVPDLSGDERLLYLSAHVPLLRRGGRALLDPSVLTARVPWPASAAVAPLVRTALARQHQLRHVLLDCIASFGTRPEVQASLVETANELIENEFGHWVDRTLQLDDVHERGRQHDHLCRLVGSLDHLGGVLEGWRRGREPRLLDAALGLYDILTRPGPGRAS